MDLREFGLTPRQTQEAERLIANGTFRYQPYIIGDRLEVGSGQILCEGRPTEMGLFATDYFADPGPAVAIGAPAPDLARFRRRNEEYRAMYDLAADKIVDFMGGSIAGKSVAEIGANAGLHLYNLKRRGAATCVSFEKNDVGPIYRLLNAVTGLDVELRSGYWLNLEHRFVPEDLPEFDIMVSSHFLNHMSDPLHHLAYICDRARELIYIWTYVIPGGESFQMTFPLDTVFKGEAFPLNLNAKVAFNEVALRSSLASLGFEDIHHIPVPLPNAEWQSFLGSFRMYAAKRTKPVKSALDAANRAVWKNAIESHLRNIS